MSLHILRNLTPALVLAGILITGSLVHSMPVWAPALPVQEPVLSCHQPAAGPANMAGTLSLHAGRSVAGQLRCDWLKCTDECDAKPWYEWFFCYEWCGTNCIH